MTEKQKQLGQSLAKMERLLILNDLYYGQYVELISTIKKQVRQLSPTRQ